MAQRIRGSRGKTRGIFTKSNRQKGKISLTKFFQSFENGQKVRLLADSAVQGGLYHRRMHGKVGIVTGKQGRCFHVAVKDHSMTKTFIIHPVHLEAV